LSKNCAACAHKAAARNTQRNKANRLELIYHYGGETPCCACCGETRIVFLTLDHIEKDGAERRRRHKGHQGTYRQLKADGFPPGIRVLCYNCNMARSLYRACPHGRSPRVEQNELVQASLSALKPGGARETPASSQDADTLRTCRRCRQRKPLTAFYASPQTRSGRQSRCSACARETAAARLRTLRVEALTHYSGGALCCACCGESTLEFLALDHVEGNGQSHRRQAGVRGGNGFFRWLKRSGYPPGLQVLCHNCNCAKGVARVCPHAGTSS
jgi:hypothetical protein